MSLIKDFQNWSQVRDQCKELNCTVKLRGRASTTENRLLMIYGPSQQAVKQSLQITLDAAMNVGLHINQLELPSLWSKSPHHETHNKKSKTELTIGTW